MTDDLTLLAEWAEGRADLLVLTIHWGRNWDRETSVLHRRMAALACRMRQGRPPGRVRGPPTRR